MVEDGQGFDFLREIEETPNSISHPKGERRALARKFLIGIDVPCPPWALRAPVVSIGDIEFQGVVPEVAQFYGTGRTHMKDIDNLKDAFSLFDESAWLDKASFMYDEEIKRTHMKDIDNLKDAFSLFDESAWLDKASFMYDEEIKSCRSTMRANGMSLTMPPTPITGRSSANSMGHFFYLDSGASRSMVFNPALLINRRDPPAGTDQFMAADGVCLAVIGYGDVEMENFRIPGVYLVRGLTVNLISVGDLASSHKVCFCFAGNECNLMLSDGRRIGGAIRRDDNQYILRFLEIE